MITRTSSQSGSTYSGSLTIDVNPKVKVKLVTDAVKFFLKPSEDNQLIMDYTFKVDSDMADLEENEPLGEYSFDEENNEFSYEIYVVDSDSLDTHVGHTVTMSIPQNAEVEVESEFSLIDIDGLEIDLEARNENGSVRVNNSTIRGSVDLENGSVQIKNTVIKSDVTTENGKIVVENCNGNVFRGRSENGSIQLRESFFGEIDCETENGQIVCQLMPSEEVRVSLRTENGPIKLYVPDEMKLDIHVETENGPIKANLKQESMGARISKRRSYTDSRNDGNNYELNMTDATISVEIETENGPVYLKNDNDMIFKTLENEFKKAEEVIQNFTVDIDGDVIKETVNETVNKVKVILESTKDQLQKNLKPVIKEFSNIFNENFDKESIKEKKQEIKETIKSAIEKIKEASHQADQSAKENEQREYRYHFHHSRPSNNSDLSTPPIPPIPPLPPIPPFKPMPTEDGSMARLKILELLEKGIINPEEAEKLLRAIDK